MHSYDHWKTTNPDDERLGPEPDAERLERDRAEADDDFGKSLDEAYRAIRERMAKGGPGWTPRVGQSGVGPGKIAEGGGDDRLPRRPAVGKTSAAARSVYPRMVVTHKMRQSVADFHMTRLEAVRDTLKTLASPEAGIGPSGAAPGKIAEEGA
jgi:hypothetical protein